jgi:hypothetical protein
LDRELILGSSAKQFSDEEQRTRQAFQTQALQASRKRLDEWQAGLQVSEK